MTAYALTPFFGSRLDPITVSSEIWLAFTQCVQQSGHLAFTDPELKVHPHAERQFRESIYRGLEDIPTRDVSAQFRTGPRPQTPQERMRSVEGGKLLKIVFDILDEGGGLRAIRRHYK